MKNTRLILLIFDIPCFPGWIHPFGFQFARSGRVRKKIEAMKTAPRGPFARIRWFCNDGTILPPKPYACAEHGGGHQHGEWTDEVKQMRASGYFIANVLADLDVDQIVNEPGYSDYSIRFSSRDF